MRRDLTTRSIILEMRDRFEIGRQFDGEVDNICDCGSGSLAHHLGAAFGLGAQPCYANQAPGRGLGALPNGGRVAAKSGYRCLLLPMVTKLVGDYVGDIYHRA